MAPSIKHVVSDNIQSLQAAYQSGEFVFTHAGLSSEWLDDMVVGWSVDSLAATVNDLFRYQPNKIAYRSFKYYDYENNIATLSSGYGNEPYQSPIWIRPAALMAANKKTLRKQIIQVVGHTPQDNIDLNGKFTGGRYYFIDTMDTTGEYLVWQDNKLTVNSVK